MGEENLAASERELSDAVDEVLNEATVEVDEVATLTSDLQRLQAEYANYRKRVDRDRVSTTEFAFAAVLLELKNLGSLSLTKHQSHLIPRFMKL